jgi:1-acyl-sn-glycerol-3-phosphate acyltransferase
VKFLAFFRSILSYTLIFIVCIIVIVPCGFSALLPEPYRYNRFYFLFCNLFYKSVIYFSFLPINIVGKENLTKYSSAIFAGNHQSALDIPVMGYLVGSRPHVWLVLSYYAKTLVLGFFVRRMNILVNREKSSQASRSLVKAIKFLKKYTNMSLIIFPEGRRIKDKTISSFMKGFATAAKSTGRPIVPIYMPNNGKIYPVNAFLIRYYPLEVVIGKPIYYKESDTDESFSMQVHNWFVNESNRVR